MCRGEPSNARVPVPPAESHLPYSLVAARTPSGAAKLERGRERFRFMWDSCDHGSRRACRSAGQDG